jgi:hypothetical protein
VLHDSPHSKLLIFHGTTVSTGTGSPHWRGFTISIRHTTLTKTPLDEWSARRRDLYLTTHKTHTRQTCKPPSGIQNHNPSKQAATDPWLRERGPWDRKELLVMHCVFCEVQARQCSSQTWPWRPRREADIYSYTLPLTSALDGVGGRLHDPAALPPEKEPGTHLQEAGWASERLWTDAENLAPNGFRSPDGPACNASLHRLSYHRPLCEVPN